QHPPVERGKAGGEVDRRRRLAHTALLVGDRENATHSCPHYRSGRRADVPRGTSVSKPQPALRKTAIARRSERGRGRDRSKARCGASSSESAAASVVQASSAPPFERKGASPTSSPRLPTARTVATFQPAASTRSTRSSSTSPFSTGTLRRTCRRNAAR